MLRLVWWWEGGEGRGGMLPVLPDKHIWLSHKIYDLMLDNSIYYDNFQIMRVSYQAFSEFGSQ